jgi:hypothetical protein
MTAKKRATIAASISVIIVIVGRAMMASGNKNVGLLGALILLPGQLVNLLTRGVHASWDGPFCEFINVAVPGVLWFGFILFLLVYARTDGKRWLQCLHWPSDKGVSCM